MNHVFIICMENKFKYSSIILFYIVEFISGGKTGDYKNWC